MIFFTTYLQQSSVRTGFSATARLLQAGGGGLFRFVESWLRVKAGVLNPVVSLQSSKIQHRARHPARSPGPWLVGLAVLATGTTWGQEALRNSIANRNVTQSDFVQASSEPYLFKMGDLRLRAVPSLAVEYNDNVQSSQNLAEDDFILRPMVRLDASYPVGQRNLLRLNVGLGYDYYFNHSDLSTLRLESGTQLSFDVYVKDVQINLHEQCSYARDSSQEAAIANTAQYGVVNNTVGLSVAWSLKDINLSVGYDHANVISPAQQFQSQDSSSELVVGRVGFVVDPKLVVGTEFTGAFTKYDQQVLNNNSSYSAGVYADWQPGAYFRVQPRVGYTITAFQQSSLSRQTADISSWYADLSISHNITKVISYSLSAGHEVRAGIQGADAVEDWYVRPAMHWNIIKNLNLNTGFSFEHGKQGVGNVSGNLVENYDWWSFNLGLNQPITDRLNAGLDYRLTLRSSSSANREYTQNLVTLNLTYRLQ